MTVATGDSPRDEPDPSEAAGLRLLCCDRIYTLPARALPELERYLIGLADHYRAPRLFAAWKATEDGYADP
jgi:hypothetical protein